MSTETRTVKSGWCADAARAEQRGNFSAADRLHDTCKCPTTCPCKCHGADS